MEVRTRYILFLNNGMEIWVVAVYYYCIYNTQKSYKVTDREQHDYFTRILLTILVLLYVLYIL